MKPLRWYALDGYGQCKTVDRSEGDESLHFGGGIIFLAAMHRVIIVPME